MDPKINKLAYLISELLLDCNDDRGVELDAVAHTGLGELSVYTSAPDGSKQIFTVSIKPS